MLRVDLNCDLGESYGRYTLGLDEEVIPFISSANVACGLHAGDPGVMARTVALCAEAGVCIGAHPGFPDLQGFGRRNMDIAPAELGGMVLYQVGALYGFCRAAGVELHHVKPHGAMYNMAVKDEAMAAAICRAVKRFSPELAILAPGGSKLEEAAAECGLPFICEVFADRAYMADGSLVPRSRPGAVIEDEAEAIARVIRMVADGEVQTADGQVIAVKADSVCVHGDGAKALAFVQKIRAALQQAGVEIRAMSAE